jgi:hypothetical protein
MELERLYDGLKDIFGFYARHVLFISQSQSEWTLRILLYIALTYFNCVRFILIYLKYQIIFNKNDTKYFNFNLF